MFFNIETARKISLTYEIVCKPLCKELVLPQTAFDILMFLGNNPAYKTAADIVDIRKIKANLVSINVERLVRDGYITRYPVAADRRKTELTCTDKAMPIIERGRKLQNDFFRELVADMDKDTINAFFSALHIVESNLDKIIEKQR